MSFLSRLACLAVILAPLCAWAEEPGLPVIPERVDQICILPIEGTNTVRVFFLRGERFRCSRVLDEECYFWVIVPPVVELHFQDYWTAQRIVSAPTLTIYEPGVNPDDEQNCLAWHNMARKMDDFTQP